MGSYVYDTFHHGPQCRTLASEYAVDAVILNQCLPSDVDNPRAANAVTWQQIAAPHKYTCALQQRKLLVISSQYGATDTTCSLQPTSRQTLRHDFFCTKDSDSGMYKLSHCGNLPDALALRDQLVIKAYTNARCSADAKTRGYIFGACSRMHDPNTKQPLLTYARLSLAMTYTQGPNTGGGSRWAPGTVVWVVEQEVFDSASCASAPIKTVKIEYGSDQNCKLNPLRPNFFYTFAARVKSPGGTAISAIPWMFDS